MQVDERQAVCRLFVPHLHPSLSSSFPLHLTSRAYNLRLPPCSATFDPDTIRSRLRELAFLNSRATIFFRVLDGKEAKGAASASNGAAAAGGSANGSSGNSNGTAAAATLSPAAAEATAAGWEVYHYSGGLAEYVRYLNRDKETIHEPFYFSKQASSRQPPAPPPPIHGPWLWGGWDNDGIAQEGKGRD